jgi:nucleotide-binding universal stress UspA family protein
MSYRKTQRMQGASRAGKLLRALGALCLGVASFALLPATMAAASTSQIGVFVDQPTPTTVPPTTTTPPSTPTTTPPTPTTAPTPTTTPVTSPPTTVPQTTQATLPDVLPPVEETAKAPADTGFVATAKKTASATKKVVTDVISGKPVADAIEAVLPQSAADVVVPAVRTASTFVFPIGLAGAVVAFLGLQQRIDAGDPKLTAAPLAHDDDEVKFL